MEVTVNGLKLNYEQSGTGPDVLLLHGWGSSTVVYKSIMQNIAGFRFTALDFPGCGKSETMAQPYTLDDYCNLVLEFIKAAGLIEPVLCGHSHGGRVCINLAGSGLYTPPKMILLDAAGIIPKKSFKQKFKSAQFKIIKKILSLPIIKNHSEALLNKARAHYGSADYKAAPPVLRKTLVNLVNTDLKSVLQNIACPTLLIWGENDTATPLSDAKIMEKLIPDAGLCVLKKSGHFSFCEQPALANSIINSFLN